MFCPNCGRDCGEDRFCVACGTRIPREMEMVREQMPCSHYEGNETAEGCCAYGGEKHSKGSAVKLPKRTNTQKGSPVIPTSRGFLGMNGRAVLLSETSVTISSGSRITIPYSELSAVIYLRPEYDGWKSGALLLRRGPNSQAPVPERKKIGSDPVSVSFSREQDTQFYHIFQLLKTLAPSDARCEMLLPERKLRDLEQSAQMVDLEYFWNMYAPYRERAASGVSAKHGLKKEVARALIDRTFDENQKILYAVDPLDAVRDMGLIVEHMRKEENRASKQRAESRARREKEELQSTLDLIWLTQLGGKEND